MSLASAWPEVVVPLEVAAAMALLVRRGLYAIEARIGAPGRGDDRDRPRRLRAVTNCYGFCGRPELACSR